MLADQRGELQVRERADRRVDRRVQMHADFGDLIPVAQGGHDDVLGQHRMAALARTRQEAFRREDAVHRMTAADQALGTGERLGAQVDFRLIPELQPIVGECLVEVHHGERTLGKMRVDDDLPDRLAAERLAERRAHVESVPGADAAHVFQQVDIAAAH